MSAIQLSKYLKSVTRFHGLSFTTDSATFTRPAIVILTEFPFRCTLGMVLIKLTRCHSSNKYLQVGIFYLWWGTNIADIPRKISWLLLVLLFLAFIVKQLFTA